MEALYPRPLRAGDTIAILSPATEVKREYVEGAAARISERGFVPLLMPGVLGPRCGSYASDEATRTGALLEALRRPDVRAILCARGGYGCVHLLPSLPSELIAADPKWLIGFSDVSALHAAWQRAGVASLHAGMAKHLTLLPPDDPTVEAFWRILTEPDPHTCYDIATDPLSRTGSAEGVLRGGNLAVLDGLAATPYDLLDIAPGQDAVLFLEDIAEPIYKVERILYRLMLGGTLQRAKGLIFGQFTDYRPDRNFGAMEEMVHRFAERYVPAGVPVAYRFPAGHVDYNLPLVEGCRCRLEIDSSRTTLCMQP